MESDLGLHHIGDPDVIWTLLILINYVTYLKLLWNPWCKQIQAWRFQDKQN